MRTARVLLVVAPTLGIAAAIGCSLGLDPSLINATNDGGTPPPPDGPLPDGGRPPGDAPPGDSVAVFPDGAGCMTDNDCKVAGNACITSQRCDMTQHVCVLGICEQPATDGGAPACKSADCEMSGSCSIPVSYGFQSTSFTVTEGNTGCGGNLGACFAVVWPFVFVGTSSSVAVYQVGDPANATPPTVELDGLTFVPVRIVSVDRRVYFIGSPMGGATQHIPVAWLDVAGNPRLTKLAANAALIASSPTNLGAVYPTTGSGLFLVDTGSHAAPTEILAAPVTNATSITSYSNPGIPSTPVNHGVVAASGTRLVTYGVDPSTSFAEFDLVNQAGTPNAQAVAAQQVSAMGQTCPQSTFAEGPDGSLVWMTNSGSQPDGGPYATLSARLAWLLAGGTAASFTVTQKVDVETYPSQPAGCQGVAGPMAWIDTNAVLTTAADKNDLTQTVVQVATRAQMPPVILPQSHTLAASIGQVAAAASNGFGYVLAHDVPAPADATVHIFAPGCM